MPVVASSNVIPDQRLAAAVVREAAEVAGAAEVTIAALHVVAFNRPFFYAHDCSFVSCNGASYMLARLVRPATAGNP
jgi:hypothetical protein